MNSSTSKTDLDEQAKAFGAWAKEQGRDTACTYDTERSRWVFLNPMTADLWSAWQAALSHPLPNAGNYSRAELKEITDLPDFAIAAAFRNVAARNYSAAFASLFRAHVLEVARKQVISNAAALAAAPVQEGAPSPAFDVETPMRQAFNLGQTYWQQADSEYTSQHRKADVTRAKFEEIVAETVRAASFMAAPVEAAPSVLPVVVPSEPTDNDIYAVWDSCREDDEWLQANEHKKWLTFARAILSLRAVTL